MLRKISIILLVGLFLSSCGYLANLNVTENAGSEARGYEIITVEDLQDLMEEEDITLINVHIPLEGNIPDTDLEIPFDEIENFTDQLPENKDEKIVIYCRSGGMGNTASETLIDLGYTDVSNLEGGYNVWKAMDLPFEE